MTLSIEQEHTLILDSYSATPIVDVDGKENANHSYYSNGLVCFFY